VPGEDANEMKVAIFDAYPKSVGGAHVIAREVARAGARTAEWSTTVVLGQDAAVAAWFRAEGVDVEIVETPRGLLHFAGSWQRHVFSMAVAFPLLWWRLRRLLAEHDLVHVHDFRGLVYAGPAALLARRRIVVHVHNGENGARAWHRLVGLLVRRGVPVLVPARSGAEAWSGRHSADLVELPNPVGTIERTAEDAQPTVVTMARLDRDKGLPDLLDAMERVIGADPRARLVIAGGRSPGQDELADSLHTRAEQVGPVSMPGQVADITTVLSGAWIYVQPSIREPFGMGALEASAAGLPVVASRVGGLRDVVVDGETGVLVPSGDPAALAEAITRLIADPAERRRLGDNGQRRARADFTPDAFAKRLAAVYRARAER
jgi:glycosyltransferase involved in cell wall biosynthesis